MRNFELGVSSLFGFSLAYLLVGGVKHISGCSFFLSVLDDSCLNSVSICSRLVLKSFSDFSSLSAIAVILSNPKYSYFYLLLPS